MLQRKVCLVGVPAVGKTSLVRRFVEGRFSEAYLTTIGVAISRRVVEAGPGGAPLAEPVTLVVWDLNGDDAFTPLRSSYARGASGVLLVADGTRPDTLGAALALHARLETELGAVLPAVVCLNKRDLDGWDLDPAAPELDRFPVLETSALDGRGVEEAFARLAG